MPQIPITFVFYSNSFSLKVYIPAAQTILLGDLGFSWGLPGDLGLHKHLPVNPWVQGNLPNYRLTDLFFCCSIRISWRYKMAAMLTSVMFHSIHSFCCIYSEFCYYIVSFIIYIQSSVICKNFCMHIHGFIYSLQLINLIVHFYHIYVTSILWYFYSVTHQLNL